MPQDKEVRIYTISTCSHCKATKKLLNECKVEYEFTDVDLLDGDEKEAILEDVRKFNPRCSYPTIIIGDKVIVGYKEKEILDALGLTTRAGTEGKPSRDPESKAKDLYERLEKINVPKGYYFNKDQKRTFELLEALIENKNRYGYMACPCRLAADDREIDKDIMCPCDYREPDVEEFGSCYCNLYVSKDWNDEKIPHAYVPERRTTDKKRP